MQLAYIPVRYMLRHKIEFLTYLTVEFCRYSLYYIFGIIIKDYLTHFSMYLVVSPVSYIFNSEIIDTGNPVNITIP